MSLEQIFRSLTRPDDRPDEYAAEAVPGQHAYQVARDSGGRPAILAKTADDGPSPADIVLRNLAVRHKVTAVAQGKNSERFRASIITCTSDDNQLHGYFLRHAAAMIEEAGPKPTSADIGRAVSHLVELFRLIEEPAKKSIQGLWAELLLIAQSKDAARLLKAWHSTPYDRYDFTEGHEHIEVKSCRGPERVHHFSHEQLVVPRESELLVTSMLVQPAGGGVTVADLAEEVKGRREMTPKLRRRLDLVIAETLGESWKESSLAFDRASAVASIQHFRASAIPRLHPPFPAGVTDVRFRADLRDAKPTDPSACGPEGGLFRGLPTAPRAVQ